MSSVAVERNWTWRQLAAMPDDGLRHELVAGEHLVTPSPSTRHQVVSMRLSAALHAWADQTAAGVVLHAPFDVKLSATTVLVPDLTYFSSARFAAAVNNRHATRAPDLVVEILSPATRRRDSGTKRAVYEREGVREYWLVDPDAHRITILSRATPDTGFTVITQLPAAIGATLTSPLLPGFHLALDRLFAPAAGHGR
jgi:Uma2 family endonuclease